MNPQHPCEYIANSSESLSFIQVDNTVSPRFELHISPVDGEGTGRISAFITDDTRATRITLSSEVLGIQERQEETFPNFVIDRCGPKWSTRRISGEALQVGVLKRRATDRTSPTGCREVRSNPCTGPVAGSIPADVEKIFTRGR